jgi:hypothetical protein
MEFAVLGALLALLELYRKESGVYCVTDDAAVDGGVGGSDGVAGWAAGFALMIATSASANGVYPRPFRSTLWVDLNVEEDVDEEAVRGGAGVGVGRGGIPGRGERRLGIAVLLKTLLSV